MTNQYVSRARALWQRDVGNEAYYLIPGSAAGSGRRLKSRFNIQGVADNKRYSVYCGLCGDPMRCDAAICLAEVPCLQIDRPIWAYIYVCAAPECRRGANAQLGGSWATYHWRESLARPVNVNDSWLRVVFDEYQDDSEGIATVSDLEPVIVRPGRDLLDPTDFGWYPCDGFASHAQQALKEIDDPLVVNEVVSELTRDIPDWHSAKLCGYPHWRFVQLDGGCECSMRGSLVLTFSNELFPSLCDPDVSAWFFICKRKPMEHSRSLIFQRSPNHDQLIGNVRYLASLAL
jgi:hypothetical protein